MATIYKIHPAIGLARVGNSPDEFFIGPERPGEIPEPSGGFKDTQCRIKRQAARFRIFAHKDDGTVEEVTNAEADITWTVHLVNKKAAYPGRGNSESQSDMTIDPGPRTIDGPNQQKKFDNGKIQFSGTAEETVPLGEIRSNSEGHLIVLGGFGAAASPDGSGMSSFWGNAGWYDDVADGPVTASIKLRTNNTAHSVEGAWIIVAPPKYAPHQDSIITLYDRLLQVAIDGGMLAAPTTTSYTNDIYPILRRARDSQWVRDTFGAHMWPDHVTTPSLRSAIFNRLREPTGGGSNMPPLNESPSGLDGRLTQVQYDHMSRWDAGTYSDDWSGVPTPAPNISPDGLDRAALEACVGGAFYPGIEAGGRNPSERPLLNPSNFTGPLRVDHSTLSAGDLTEVMALPWQGRFRSLF